MVILLLSGMLLGLLFAWRQERQWWFSGYQTGKVFGYSQGFEAGRSMGRVEGHAEGYRLALNQWEANQPLFRSRDAMDVEGFLKDCEAHPWAPPEFPE